MYDTDELYARAAVSLGVTPEQLDEALRDVTLLSGSSYAIEVTQEDELTLLVPMEADPDENVPPLAVVMMGCAMRAQKDVEFVKQMMAWMEENS